MHELTYIVYKECVSGLEARFDSWPSQTKDFKPSVTSRHGPDITLNVLKGTLNPIQNNIYIRTRAIIFVQIKCIGAGGVCKGPSRRLYNKEAKHLLR